MALFKMKPWYRNKKELSYYGVATPLSSTTNSPVSVSFDDAYAFIIGGKINSSGNFSTKFNAYNNTLTKITMSDLTSGLDNISAAGSHNGDYAIIIGTDCYPKCYNKSLVKSTASSLRTTSNRYYFQVTHVGDYVIIAGSSVDTCKDVDAYNKSLTRVTAPNLYYGRTIRKGNYAVSLNNAYAFINDESRYALYDASLTYRTNDALGYSIQIPGSWTGNVAIKDYVLMSTITQSKSKIYTYNSSITKQQLSEDLTNTRNLMGIISLKDNALFAGGTASDSSYDPSYQYYKNVDAYDTSLIKSIIEDLPVAKISMGAASVGDYALFAGGWEGGTWNVLNSVNVYQYK